MSDLNDKLKQVSELLTRDDFPDSIIQLLSAIAEQKKQTNSSTPESNLPISQEAVRTQNILTEPVSENDHINSSENLTPKDILSKLRPNNADPKVSLLKSIRQFVGPARKNSIDKCIKLLGFIELSQVMDIGKNKH